MENNYVKETDPFNRKLQLIQFIHTLRGTRDKTEEFCLEEYEAFQERLRECVRWWRFLKLYPANFGVPESLLW